MLSKSYRGEIKSVNTNEFSCSLESNGTISFNQSGYGDRCVNGNRYQVTVNASELKDTAKKCLKQIGEISGVDYRIAIVIDNKIVGWL